MFSGFGDFNISLQWSYSITKLGFNLKLKKKKREKFVKG